MTTADVLSTGLYALASLIAAPVAAALTGLLMKAWTWVDMKTSAQDKTNLEAELHTAISIGLNVLLPDIAAKGRHDAATKAEVLKIAAAYLKERFPERAVQLATAAGVSVSDLSSPTATSAIITTLEGRFVSSVAATFAVPPPGRVASASVPATAATLPAA